MILFLKIVQKIILNCFQASSIALIVAASLMLHQPEKYITEWKNMKKSDTVKEMQINEVGENGIERKLKTNVLHTTLKYSVTHLTANIFESRPMPTPIKIFIRAASDSKL